MQQALPRPSLAALAVAVAVAACGTTDNGSPGVLTGRFGNPTSHAELAASRTSAVLDLACGTYFRSTAPITLNPDRTFYQTGEFRGGFGVNFGVAPAAIHGTLDPFGHAVAMVLDVENTPPYQWQFSLTRGTDGKVDSLVCALAMGS